MQGRLRILILIALLIVVGAIVAVFLLGGNGNDNNTNTNNTGTTDNNQPNATAVPTEIPSTPVPTQELVDIVVAVQSINRGSVITPDAVRLQPWPLEAAPFNALSSTEEVIGKRARTDIYIEQPILFSMVVENLSELASVGSDAAAIIPSGLVGVTLPVDRFTSVGYGVQPGDRVDIIVSLLFIDIDEEFQSILPNQINLIGISEDPDNPGQFTLNIGAELPGRFESVNIPIVGAMPAVVRPSEEGRPRLVTQRTITDALVLWVGNFPLDGKLFEDLPTPTPEIPPDAPTPLPSGQVAAAAVVQPPPDIVTLAVTPQEAVVITWMVEARIPITFTLRSASGVSGVPTDPVSLDYIMNDYDITVPAKRGFSIQPAIRSIRQLIAPSTVTASG